MMIKSHFHKDCKNHPSSTLSNFNLQNFADLVVGMKKYIEVDNSIFELLVENLFSDE